MYIESCNSSGYIFVGKRGIGVIYRVVYGEVYGEYSSQDKSERKKKEHTMFVTMGTNTVCYTLKGLPK